MYKTTQPVRELSRSIHFYSIFPAKNQITFTNWFIKIQYKINIEVVVQSYLILCDPKDCSMSGFPVLHIEERYAKKNPGNLLFLYGHRFTSIKKKIQK